jgi:hypothetical protein
LARQIIQHLSEMPLEAQDHIHGFDAESQALAVGLRGGSAAGASHAPIHPRDQIVEFLSVASREPLDQLHFVVDPALKLIGHNYAF